MTESEAPRRRRLRRLARRASVIVAAVVAALTVASFVYNLATGPAPRPPGLRMLSAGGFDTRYRTWGTSGSPVVLVPAAFETADTFDALATALGTDHRVFAIDLTGTGYSTPSPPFTASHLADQLVAFMAAEGLTGANAPVIVGHSSGAAVVGMAALRGRNVVAGVMFLDGDAIGLGGAPVANRLATGQPVPDDDPPARAELLVADPDDLQHPVRAGLPAADRGRRRNLAPAAAAAWIRISRRVHDPARDPQHDHRGIQPAAGKRRAQASGIRHP